LVSARIYSQTTKSASTVGVAQDLPNSLLTEIRYGAGRIRIADERPLAEDDQCVRAYVAAARSNALIRAQNRDLPQALSRISASVITGSRLNFFGTLQTTSGHGLWDHPRTSERWNGLLQNFGKLG